MSARLSRVLTVVLAILAAVALVMAGVVNTKLARRLEKAEVSLRAAERAFSEEQAKAEERIERLENGIAPLLSGTSHKAVSGRYQIVTTGGGGELGYKLDTLTGRVWVVTMGGDFEISRPTPSSLGTPHSTKRDLTWADIGECKEFKQATAEDRGQIARAFYYDFVVQDPDYQALPPEQQLEVLKKFMEECNRDIGDEVVSEQLNALLEGNHRWRHRGAALDHIEKVLSKKSDLTLEEMITFQAKLRAERIHSSGRNMAEEEADQLGGGEGE